LNNGRVILKNVPAITLDVLPASRGDCLLIECHRPEGPWRLLIDGGMPGDWPTLKARIKSIPRAQRHIDLAVVSHIDADHIGGMLPLLGDTELGVTFGDVWFNGLPQLPEPDEGRTRSVAQGESLVKLLSGDANAKALPWNVAFGGRAVSTGKDTGYLEVKRDGWPQITLLSPDHKRLVSLRKKWLQSIDYLKRGEAEDPARAPEPLASLKNLQQLAKTKTDPDRSAANGSSIAFLLEHRGASCLLAADAFYGVLGRALTALVNARGVQQLSIDAFKLPHHGSKGNVIAPLLKLVPARHYIVSTNGERFGHPDDIALARVLTSVSNRPKLWFNFDNAANRRWGAEPLRKVHEHGVRYPKQADAGVRLNLPVRPEGSKS
jgi:hypothetical protein